MRKYAGGGPSGRGWSLVDDWRCKFRYAAQHALGWGQGSREALVRGDLAHRGLAAYFAQLQALQQGEDPLAFYGVEETLHHAVQVSGDDPTYQAWLEPVSAALRAHIAYLEATYDWRIVAVETYDELWLDNRGCIVDTPPPDASAIRARVLHHPLEVQRGPAYVHTMRYDVTVELGGRILDIDHKTMVVTSPSQARMKGHQYAGSGQLLLMRERGARRWGRRYGGLWVNAVPLRAGKDGRFLELPLYPVDGSAEATQRAARQKVAVEQELELYSAHWRPEDWPGAMTMQGPCHDRYEGTCAFYNRCKRGLSQQ